ncbi:Ig-like domain-containing protein [Nibrella saemangeumensis]|uniref:Ig-like domain-containing protein n=2 Tax=Nibrella saemangeumensis TaxID=1084526 RepID=A0ABP8MJV4_9BACT
MDIPVVPTASFTVQNNNCAVPCEVSFTSTAQNVSSYRWDFGDGQTSSDANPKHTYTQAGTYSIKLIAKGEGGNVGSTQSVKVQAGIPQKVWDKSFGGSAEDKLNIIIPTADGGYLLGGNSYSNISAEKSENSKGNSDYWVIKIGLNGEKQWDRTLGGAGEEGLASIVSTSDGGFLLAGASASDISGDKSENSRGGLDYWIVKIGSNGTKQWDKTLGGNSTEYLASIIATTDGFLIAGSSASDASWEKSENSKGSFDCWIVKLGANGAKQWDKTFGGSAEDVVRSIVATTDGGFLFGGRSFSNASGDKSENGRGICDWWIIKIGASGVKLWDKTFGGSEWEESCSITPTTDGGALLVGPSGSNASGDKSENNKGGFDCWIVKIGANGVKQWDKTFGSLEWDWLDSSIATLDGGFLLGGWSASNAFGDKSENSRGGTDYWILKIDANGAKQWDKTFGGIGDDAINSICVSVDRGFLLGGVSTSSASGDKSSPNYGDKDYWVIKIR